MSYFELKDISFGLNGSKILDNISLKIPEPGGIYALVGPNGAGKTTLFNIIEGFLKQTMGSIILNGQDISKLNIKERIKKGMGRLWQDIRIFDKMTVLENICLAAKNQTGENIFQLFINRKKYQQEEEQIINKAGHILVLLGLEDNENSLAENLSYGQQKLVGIGRCLMSDSSFLLLDEPFSGLSHIAIAEVQKKLEEIAYNGKTIFMIEHEIAKTLVIAKKVFILNQGRLNFESSNPVKIKEALNTIYSGI